jgi:hypothetical protein
MFFSIVSQNGGLGDRWGCATSVLRIETGCISSPYREKDKKYREFSSYKTEAIDIMVLLYDLANDRYKTNHCVEFSEEEQKLIEVLGEMLAETGRSVLWQDFKEFLFECRDNEPTQHKAIKFLGRDKLFGHRVLESQHGKLN